MRPHLRIHPASGIVALAMLACGGEAQRTSTSAFPDSLVDTEVVAAVNAQDITARDLRLFTLTYVPTATDSLYDRIFNLELLKGYIDRMLLWQEAATAGVVITDSTVSWYVARLTESMRGAAALNKHLASLDMTRADLERNVRRDLMVRSLVENRIAADVTVTDAEAKEYYEANRDRFKAAFGSAADSFDNVRDYVVADLRRKTLAKEMENHLRRLRATAIIEPKFDLGGLTQRESTIFTR